MGEVVKELDKILNPQSNFDPEDDIHEETKAKLINKEDIGDDTVINNHHDDDVKSKKRRGKSMIDELDEDPRYKGKIVTREELDDDDQHIPDDLSDDDLSDDDLNHGDAEADDEDIDSDEFGAADDEMKSFSHADLMGGDDSDDSDTGGATFNDEDDEEIDSDEADGYEVDEDGGGGMKLFSSSGSGGVDVSERREATKQQLGLWDGSMERRIKLQKTLNPANRLPRPGNFDLFMERAGADIKKAHRGANKAVDELQAVMLELFQLQTKHCKGLTVEQPATTALKLDMTTKSLDQFLTKRNGALRKHRQSVLKFWYDKTRLAGTSIKNKNFDSLERPTNDQIQHILADRDRVMKRTQLKRSVYQVLGEEAAASSEHDAHLQDVSPETFDDGDFYQQQIRELIGSKTVGKTTAADADGIETTRQWLKFQKLRTKVKKKVDTKASKGRKVRYHIHPKLVSFMAPCDKSTWSDGKINQMSRLMFGKTD